MQIKDYTKSEALKYIKKHNDLSTLCLKSLNVSFETFLKFAQRSKEDRTKLLKILVNQFE